MWAKAMKREKITNPGDSTEQGKENLLLKKDYHGQAITSGGTPFAV